MNDYVNISGEYKIINLLILIQIHKLILMKPIDKNYKKIKIFSKFLYLKK